MIRRPPRSTLFPTRRSSDLDLADRIGVMSYGRLIEVGTPRDLYMRPQTEFVASFLGTANILLGNTEKERIQIGPHVDRKSTRLNSSHSQISYAVFCLKKKRV